MFRVVLLGLLLSFLIGLNNVGLAISELQRFKHPTKGDGYLSLLVVGDWGRRGAYNQSEVALQVGIIGEKLDLDLVISTGDHFYEDGLKLDLDLVHKSFTKIYTAPSLQKQWYNVLGNHDYRGDVEAQLSPVLREKDHKWLCLRSFIVETEMAEFVFVDTTPFVDKYFKEKEHTYDWSGITPRDEYLTNLLKEVDSTLKESTAKWKIVVGHHTIKSAGTHSNTVELEQRLLPILEANDVDLYINGHDHCLEQISSSNSPLQFLTSGGGSKAWRGFMSLYLTGTKADIVFYNVFGEVLHKWSRSKQLSFAV
ncbi:hypothetical protein K2173_016668 [Erythroxylum novogranatense]|uniref:Purple acid phosphatase n=1 Tax=Erythroxylum novogranatense TaxID=1862640 RepID=A0AAV8SGW7_9ROSI|nr:hypothetical protein K2173_016668 [Erythroxylum novogranatense]